ncbi:hypothetical protein [Thalassotalea sp. PLHSN55]|uniref:hypothetical protein n=1 Tax=Thalassotalea sp. PLHSN55 TaxID=3435888 RepID=UPI003F856764
MQTEQSSTSIIKASIIALVIALTTLVLFILPAEYNVDPTGMGEKLGLTVFNQPAENNQVESQSSDGQQDSVIVTVPAGKGIEYKLAMAQYEKVNYEWMTDGGPLYVDLHGEPKGDTTGYFESYTIATAEQMKGSFTAPFEGSHGWYWKNESDKEMQVQVIFSGEYTIEGLK